jgi:hypothetical protein
MKTLILLSALILTASSVNSQTKEWSGNMRNSGKKQVTSSRVTENKSRKGNSSSINESRRVKVNDVAANNYRSGSFREVRRESNFQNNNEKFMRTDFNKTDNARRNAERVFISEKNYTPVYRREFHEPERFGNGNFESRHTRIEHWNYSEYERSRHFLPLNIRRERFPFFMPHLAGLIWSLELRNEYFRMYPEFRIRDYNYGYRIPSISAYDANEYIGDIAIVYGDILATEYSPENDEYYLYIGQYFPNQDFSIVVPGNIAREYSVNPDLYFQNAHIAVSGLITSYNNKPEIIVKRASQLSRYYR